MQRHYCLCDMSDGFKGLFDPALEMYCFCDVNNSATPNDLISYCKSNTPILNKGKVDKSKVPNEHKNKQTLAAVPKDEKMYTQISSDGEEPILIQIPLDGIDIESEKNEEKFNSFYDDIESVNIIPETEDQIKFSNFKSTLWRKDVVMKTIIRSMRRFYLEEFREFFRLKRNKSISLWSRELIRRKSSKYLISIFGDECSEIMKSLLLAIINPKKPFINEDNEFIRLRESVHNLFAFFNTTKLTNLLKIKEFSHLVLHFLNNPSILNRISNKAVNPINQEAFEFFIDEIIRICEYQIKTSH